MTELTDQPFDLDGRLNSLFRDAPRLSADRVVAAALTDVSATPQARSLFAIEATAFRVSLLAASLAVLAIGLGLGLGPRLIGSDASPSPEVSESPVPYDLPDGYEWYRNEFDGYEIAVPRTLQALVEPGDGELREGVTRFGSDVQGDSLSGLIVSVGSPEGIVYLCQGIACNPVVVTSVEELEAAIQARWPNLGASRERIVATTLGGEDARLRQPTWSGTGWPGGNQVCSAYAMHGTRPVTLTVPCNEFSAGTPKSLSTLERVVDSFRFLSPTPDAVGLRLYTNTELGFAVRVPEDWGEPQPAGAYLEDAGGAVGFVNPEGGLNRHSPVMYVSVGTPDGAVKLCNFAWECETIVARTLDELIAAAEGIRDPDSLTEGGLGVRPIPVDEDTTLDGEPARYEGYEPFHGGTTIPWLEHVLTFHEGRPVIVGFDHYTFGTANSISAYRRAILESFRFLDAGPASTEPGLSLYTNTDIGYEILVPRGWTEIPFDPHPSGGPPTGVTTFGHEFDQQALLTVSIGTIDGEFNLCDGPCVPTAATTLDELEDALDLERTIMVGGTPGTPFEEVRISYIVEDAMLGSAEARFARLDDPEGVLPFHHFIFGIVQDRPVVLAVASTRNWGMAGDPTTEVLDAEQINAIGASFRFLD